MSKRFTQALITRRSDAKGKKRWSIVERSFWWYIGDVGSKFTSRIEKGMRTDGFSVPWFTRWFLSQNDHGVQSAVNHDIGYRFNTVFVESEIGEDDYYTVYMTKAFWDKQFYEGMLVLGTPKWKANLMYAGVKAGGHVAWYRWRKKNLKHPLDT